MSRNFSNLITGFTEATKDSNIPRIFTKWSAISAIAGAMGRRCWYDFNTFKVYPNLYIVQVARPGRGKSVSLGLPFGKVYSKLAEPLGTEKEDNTYEPDYEKYKLVHPLRLSTAKITPEKLGVDIKEVEHKDILLSTMDESHYDASMTMVTSEFGVFMNRHDHFLQMFMTDMWDAHDTYSYRTKTAGSILINGPCLNWIACATPDQFVENLPENARSQGLLSRMIVVNYEGESLQKDLEYPFPNEQYIEYLRWDLADVAHMRGPFRFDCQETYDNLRAWIHGGMEPMPTDDNMQEYNERRLSHFIKVCMAMSASKRSTRVITQEDWEEARGSLVEVEEQMPAVLQNFGVSESGKISLDIAQEVAKRGKMSYNAVMSRALRKVKSPGEAAAMLKGMDEAGLIKIAQNLVFPGDAKKN